MKICVFSNSHGASLIDAIRENNEIWPSVEFKVYALPSQGLNQFNIDLEQRAFIGAKDHIVERIMLSSGGDTMACVDEFDAFFIYGLQFSLPCLDTRLSNAVKHAAISDSFTSSNAALKLQELRLVTNKAVFVTASPLETRFDNQYETNNHLTEKPMSYEDLCATARDALAEEPMTLLMQPPETVEAGWMTKPEFASGSRRMRASAEPHPETDTKHMNSVFGKIILQSVVTALEPV